MWSLDVKNTFAQAARFKRDVFLRAPAKWHPRGAQRIREFRGPAHGLHDAPDGLRETPQGYLLRTAEPLAKVSRKYQVSPCAPRLYFIFRGSGGAVGALATHIDDVLGCGRAGHFVEGA